MTFAIILPEKPRSLQGDAGKRQTYKQRIAVIASQTFGTAKKLTGDLYARIIWFYADKIEGDIDNIVKPILDALEGIVYLDDKIVVKCASEKVDQNNAVLSTTNIDTGIYTQIYTNIANGLYPNFVYIEIGELSTRQVVFGPVI